MFRRFSDTFLRLMAAALVTWTNTPLYRFPGEDILTNDLMLLSRTAWSADALKHNVLASIDFLQGLGTNYRMDVKVVPHFWDPAVLLSLVMPVDLALIARTFALVFLCLWSLAKLEKSLHKPSQDNQFSLSNSSVLYWPVALSYVFSPQFMYEVGHHYSAVFYALPLVILVIRNVLVKPMTWINLASFIGGLTLFISLSDLHIFFHLAAIVVFLWLFEAKSVVSQNKRFYFFVVPFLGILAFLAYSGPIGLMLGFDKTSISAHNPWDLFTYAKGFLRYLPPAILTPAFSNPLSLFVVPFLGVASLAWIHRKSEKKLHQDLLKFALFAGSFIALGMFAHAVPAISAKLPSSLRYHLPILPFCLLILFFYHQETLQKFFSDVFSSRLKTFALITGLINITLIGAILFAQPESSAELVGLGMSRSFSKVGQMRVGLIAVIPMGLIFSLLFWVSNAFNGGKALSQARLLKRGYLSVLLFPTAILALCFLNIASFHISRNLILGSSSFAFTDPELHDSLFRTIPSQVVQAIQSRHMSQLPRAFVPLAKAYYATPNRGRNDKLLPYIEWPELLGGRTFFQWRYSYTKHIQSLYANTTHEGPMNFFPPGIPRIDDAIQFATLVGAPFLITADAHFDRPDLELLGTFELEKGAVSSEFMANVNEGFLGTIDVYAIKPAVAAHEKNGFHDTRFTRTQVTLSRYQGNESQIRLPVTYQPTLIAENSEGQKINLTQGSDGFVYVERSSFTDGLTLRSSSLLGAFSLLYPLIAFMMALLWRQFIGNRPYFLSGALHNG